MEKNKFGILIFTKLVKDNDLFLKILTSEDQLIHGIAYGANSSKKKKYIPNRVLFKF